MPTVCFVTDHPDAERLIAALVPRADVRVLVTDPDPVNAVRRALDAVILLNPLTRRGLPEEADNAGDPVAVAIADVLLATASAPPEYVRPTLVPLPEDDGEEDGGEDTSLWVEESGGSD